MISSDGILIRIPASQINIVSRTSKGVRVMRLAEGERVVSAIAVREAGKKDEEEEAEDSEETQGEGTASDEGAKEE